VSEKTVDVVERVKSRKARWGWGTVVSEHNGHKLYIRVFKDAMKFDDVPAMTWDFRPIIKADGTVDETRYDGVRLPASAEELQQIADLTSCMLLTPRVVDLIWLQSTTRFDAIVNSGSPYNQIVALMPIVGKQPHKGGEITGISQMIDARIPAWGDGKGIIASVGKYWVLTNDLGDSWRLRYGEETACNYGWCSRSASGPGVTPGVQCWQRPGYQHDKHHWDPSQLIRLMFRTAKLVRADGTEDYVDLGDVAQDPELGPLITHEGELGVLRQPSVEKLPAMQPIELPPENITLNPTVGA
jgi:hypothetical protein